jgi:hypothetical protein
MTKNKKPDAIDAMAENLELAVEALTKQINHMLGKNPNLILAVLRETTFQFETIHRYKMITSVERALTTEKEKGNE